MKTKVKILIACMVTVVISLAVTLIIVKTGVHKIKNYEVPEITTEAEETFKGKTIGMSTEEIVSLYNEAFNNTANGEEIISNGHFHIYRDKSSGNFSKTRDEKMSKLMFDTMVSILDYSDYEMKGESAASLRPEDVIYASARENKDRIELKIKIKECEFKYVRHSDEVKVKNIPPERTGFGAADIYDVFEAYGQKGEDETLILEIGTFNNRSDYTEYDPADLTALIDKKTHTLIRCDLNYDLHIKDDFFDTEDINGDYWHSYSNIDLYLNADFTYPYVAVRPAKGGQTVSG